MLDNIIHNLTYDCNVLQYNSPNEEKKAGGILRPKKMAERLKGDIPKRTQLLDLTQQYIDNHLGEVAKISVRPLGHDSDFVSYQRPDDRKYYLVVRRDGDVLRINAEHFEKKP